MSPFVITPSAKADLLAIGVYTQRRWGKETRKVYLARIQAAFETLAVQPGLGVNRDEIRPGLKSFIIARHVIYFDIHTPDRIRIIRILHQAMEVLSRARSLGGHPTAQ